MPRVYCVPCEKSFRNKRDLKRHKRGRGDHQCGKTRIQYMKAKHYWYCRTHDKSFFSEAGVRSHIDSQYSQSSDHHLCTKCGDCFDDEGELRDHMEVEEDHYAYQACREVFDDYRSRGDHQSGEMRNRYIKTEHYWCCRTHDKFFTPEAGLRSYRHGDIDSWRSQSTCYYLCTKCGNCFGDEGELWDHLEVEEDHYACQACHEVFDGYVDLKNHNDNIHHDIFTSEAGLSSHHHCKKCGDDFDDLNELWDHLEVEEGHYACQACHELFDGYADLKKHNDNIHQWHTI